ncbi:MAG: HupE/UreJ family protein [Acidobacteriota bacterium]
MRKVMLLFVVLVLGAIPTAGHQFAPALLELEETSLTRVTVSWKQPTVKVRGSELRPVLPAACSGVGAPVIEREGTGMRARWEIDCPTGLNGTSVGVEGIASSRADVLLRVDLLDGRAMRHVLTADAPSYRIDGATGALDVLRDYGVLGVEHILVGWDHLLFVLALVLIVGWGRSLLFTITAFTLGHSITLGLASLGVVTVPQAPVEAAIAISIYVLAIELMLTWRGHTTLTRRRPWLVASAFGLLHGLGFAGALSEIGLPSGEIPLALFAFNLGIELGQLLFVGAVLLVTAAAMRLPVVWPRWSVAVPAYGIGAMAVFWAIERVVGLVV